MGALVRQAPPRRRQRAVVVHGAGRASLDRLPVPEVGPADVAVRVAYVGICATDLEIAEGTLGYYRDRVASYPIVPGHEVSGRVATVGGAVAHLAPGDAVVIECIQGCGACDACRRGRPIGCARRAELGVIGRNGGYAEYVVAPARFVRRLPAGADLRAACLCEPLAVALKGLGRLARSWGDDAGPRRCAVVGAGALGRLCAAVLAHRGHAVTLHDQDDRRLATVPAGIATSRALDGLDAFDALVEATGQQAALEAVLARSRAGAAILLLGLPYAEAAFSFERIVAYDKTVVGSVGSGGAEFEQALALLPSLDLTAFTRDDAAVLPLAAYRRGWALARERSHLKVMLAP